VADVLVQNEGVDRNRILLLPNGVDLERFADEKNRIAGRQLRAREGSSAGEKMLWLFPGSGWHRKGLDPLLRALARPELDGHRLWVCGRDDIAPWRQLAARLGLGDRVRFLGDRRDVEVLYKAVDAMVLPTRYDPFANVTLEAAAAGCAIVTSAANGAAEWFDDSVVAVRDSSNPGALAAALGNFVDADRRARVGAALARKASSLGWDRHVDALRAEYARIVDDKKRRKVA
jgi:UDP-glucose:(heptosyl)LPS alpha-1,3-glucosyltransferase